MGPENESKEKELCTKLKLVRVSISNISIYWTINSIIIFSANFYSY